MSNGVHVDPSKEASAQSLRLASHTTTLADEYARHGQDWETQIHQRAKEIRLMQSLGLTIPETLAEPQDTNDETEDAATKD